MSSHYYVGLVGTATYPLLFPCHETSFCIHLSRPSSNHVLKMTPFSFSVSPTVVSDINGPSNLRYRSASLSSSRSQMCFVVITRSICQLIQLRTPTYNVHQIASCFALTDNHPTVYICYVFVWNWNGIASGKDCTIKYRKDWLNYLLLRWRSSRRVWTLPKRFSASLFSLIIDHLYQDDTLAASKHIFSESKIFV